MISRIEIEKRLIQYELDIFFLTHPIADPP